MSHDLCLKQGEVCISYVRLPVLYLTTDLGVITVALFLQRILLWITDLNETLRYSGCGYQFFPLKGLEPVDDTSLCGLDYYTRGLGSIGDRFLWLQAHDYQGFTRLFSPAREC